VLASGEESGAPLGRAVVAGDSPVLSISSIPQSSDARVVATRVYITDIDGTVFYAQTDVPVGTTTLIARGPYGVGQKLTTQFMAPPPPGQFIDYTNGRIYVASGSTVYMTQPLRYNLCDLGGPDTKQHDFFMYSNRVTMLRAVDNGVFVGSDMIYYINNSGLPSANQTPLLPYPAIEGASCDIPNSRDVLFLTTRGFIQGKYDGSVKNLTEDRIAVDSAVRACMSVVEINGSKSVVAIMQESTVNPLASSEYLEAEAERAAEVK
jgi:hypothetical protein